MKARKKKNALARLSKRYARILKDGRGRHDLCSWAEFFVRVDIRDAIVSASLDEAERSAEEAYARAIEALENDPDRDAWQFVEREE